MDIQAEIEQGQETILMLLWGAPRGVSAAWEAAFDAAQARLDALLLSLIPDGAESARDVVFVFCRYGGEYSVTYPTLRDAMLAWNEGEREGSLSGVGVFASDGTVFVKGHDACHAYNRKYGLDD